MCKNGVSVKRFLSSASSPDLETSLSIPATLVTSRHEYYLGMIHGAKIRKGHSREMMVQNDVDVTFTYQIATDMYTG